MLMTRKNRPATMNCPRCGETLQSRQIKSGEVKQCPTGCGVWLDQSNIDANRVTAANSADEKRTARLRRSRASWRRN